MSESSSLLPDPGTMSETMSDPPHKIAVIGGGPAGLFAAEILAKRLGRRGYSVEIFDHMARPGRKFLMAGRSGLNLTHDEAPERFLSRYGASAPFLRESLERFTPEDLQKWTNSLGQSCYTGSSGRVLIHNAKASPLLRAWLARLNELGVTFFPRHELIGFGTKSAEFGIMQNTSNTRQNLVRLQFVTPNGPETRHVAAAVLALGGASRARLGSTGRWTRLFPEETAPFTPSNCGFIPAWTEEFCQRHEGSLLHAVSLSFGGQTRRGDIILTRRGLEGAPVYALSALLRDALHNLTKKGGYENQPPAITARLALRPNLGIKEMTHRLKSQRPRESLANRLRKALNLTPFERSLLRLLAPEAESPVELASSLSSLPLVLTATQPIDHAISTAGGLKLDALDGQFMLHRHPGLFACGEMLDWEAPTGGYLLQGCFSTAFMTACGVDHWLSSLETPSVTSGDMS